MSASPAGSAGQRHCRPRGWTARRGPGTARRRSPARVPQRGPRCRGRACRRQQLVEVALEGVIARGRGTLDERLGDRPELTERLLRGASSGGPHAAAPASGRRSGRRRSRPRRVRRGAWLATISAEVDRPRAPVGDPDLDLLADEAHRDRVAGRAEADAAELVDLALDDLADPCTQLRQRPEQLSLRPRGARRGPHRSRSAPPRSPRRTRRGPCRSPGELGDGSSLRDHEVGLHVADEVLDEALRLGVVRPRRSPGEKP